MWQDIIKNGGPNTALTWLFRIGLVALVLWVKGNFVTLERYDSDSAKRMDEWIAVGKSVQHLDDTITTFQQQFTELNDHELRLRALEKRNER